jgi:UDP-glucose 4-epimerase
VLTFALSRRRPAAEAVLIPQTKENVFNVGGSEVMTIAARAETMIKIGGIEKFEIRDFLLACKAVEIGDYHADDRAFRNATGRSPQVSMLESLRRTIDCKCFKSG